MPHPIFSAFEPVESTATGDHAFDFLGGRTRLVYKRGMANNARIVGEAVQPGAPNLNEHFFDWVAVLTAVSRAQGTFRMAELGAGWAPWLVRASLAARQRPQIKALQLMAIEADTVHYGWVKDHFRDNGLNPDEHHVLHGAATNAPGPLRFPKLDDPDETYGASLRYAGGDRPTIEVEAISMDRILAAFDGPLDLMHVDIQGTEYELLPDTMDQLKAQVKSIMVGTHYSSERHDQLVATFRENGWTPVFEFPRAETSETGFGPVTFGDGFLLYDNPALLT